MANLVELVQDPEAEISLVEGQTKILQLRASGQPDRDREPEHRRRRDLHRSAGAAPGERRAALEPLRPDVRNNDADDLG